LLRRNIHRIEKGLIMRPRRDLFAAGYVGETVDIYVKLLRHGSAQPGGKNPELAWARDVLREYFDVTAHVGQTAEARRIFEATECGGMPRAPELIPYRRELALRPTVAFEDFLMLCRRRRSVRWFENRSVPRELLDNAMLAALEAPTACNRQPFTFRLFDDPVLVAQLAQVPIGTAGFEHNFPVFGVIVGELANYTDERDRHLIYIDGALAAMSFCLAAETQGLATCLINWPDIAEREHRMAQLLGLRRDQRVVMCLAAGFPDPEGLVPRSTKKPIDLVRSYNSSTG
jgi:nitroreductase